jgi:hypothetical protein
MGWVVKSWRAEVIAAELAALEELGAEARTAVRDRRAALREPGRTPEPAATPVGRARLRESPLAELFRATTPP